MNAKLIAVFGAAIAASSTTANFTGFSHQLVNLGNNHWAVNVYANFSHVNDRVLNVYNAQISNNFDGGFYQSESNPFWKAGNTQNKNTSDDSWLAIGTNPNGSGNAGGNGGNVVADPNFVNFDDSNEATDFSTIQGSGGGAGWYNGNPANTYGYATDGQVLLAHFVAANPWGHYIIWNVTLTVFLNGATASTSGVGTGPYQIPFEPAPGALPLLTMGLFAGGRRRRQ